MSIEEYADKVGVHKRTIYNEIGRGKIKPTIVMSKNRPRLDISTFDYPINLYKRRYRGRPKLAKNKAK